MLSLSIDGPQGVFAAGADIFPRSLLIEAAAQAALILYHLSMVKEGEHPRYVLGRVKAEFFEDVMAGDDIHLHVNGGRMLVRGGYSDVKILRDQKVITDIFFVYNVNRAINL